MKRVTEVNYMEIMKVATEMEAKNKPSFTKS
jgi:hypothetical protein